ncbi:hypothetical protein TNCV_4802291 [Trichonephila clavipes]|nr:hypothetical protein TNCV_4802291 [Trichonephila clavipes]
MPSPVQSNCDAHDTIANGQYGAVWSMGHTQQDDISVFCRRRTSNTTSPCRLLHIPVVLNGFHSRKQRLLDGRCNVVDDNSNRTRRKVFEENLETAVPASLRIAARERFSRRRCSRLFSSVYSIPVCLVLFVNKRLSLLPTGRMDVVTSTSDSALYRMDVIFAAILTQVVGGRDVAQYQVLRRESQHSIDEVVDSNWK